MNPTDIETVIPVCDLISQIPEDGDGFPNAEAAEHWRQRGCGIACLRMILATFGVAVPSYWELIREGLDSNAYCDRGWIHQGLINMAVTRGIAGLANRNADAADLAAAVAAGSLVIASVTVCFRGGQPRSSGEGVYQPGGHLVLVTGVATSRTAEPVRFRVHHPSATDINNWPNRWIDVDRFAASFSGAYLAFPTASLEPAATENPTASAAP